MFVSTIAFRWKSLSSNETVSDAGDGQQHHSLYGAVVVAIPKQGIFAGAAGRGVLPTLEDDHISPQIRKGGELFEIVLLGVHEYIVRTLAIRAYELEVINSNFLKDWCTKAAKPKQSAIHVCLEWPDHDICNLLCMYVCIIL